LINKKTAANLQILSQAELVEAIGVKSVEEVINQLVIEG
jgi:hypothetical protein